MFEAFTSRTRVQAQKREFTEEERKNAAAAGHAMPDGSYPIENEDDLKNAVMSYGRAGDPEAVKYHIKQRAKGLNRMDLLPDDWTERPKDVKKSEPVDLKYYDPLLGQHQLQLIAKGELATSNGNNDLTDTAKAYYTAKDKAHAATDGANKASSDCFSNNWNSDAHSFAEKAHGIAAEAHKDAAKAARANNDSKNDEYHKQKIETHQKMSDVHSSMHTLKSEASPLDKAMMELKLAMAGANASTGAVKGDAPGHPFRGNQHTSGGGAGDDADKAYAERVKAQLEGMTDNKKVTALTEWFKAEGKEVPSADTMKRLASMDHDSMMSAVAELARGGASKDSYDKKGMPIADHPYHEKTSNSLHFIMRDAHEAATNAHAMGDSKGEGKYLDQINDAATVLNYRRSNGITEPRAAKKNEVFAYFDPLLGAGVQIHVTKSNPNHDEKGRFSSGDGGGGDKGGEPPKPGSKEWLDAKSSGPMHKYEDSTGKMHHGYMEQYLDHGGSDHTAFMRDHQTGDLHLVSGSRLKSMGVVSAEEKAKVQGGDDKGGKTGDRTASYREAMAAGHDAANKQMKAAGRTAWNEDDWNTAASTVAKLTGGGGSTEPKPTEIKPEAKPADEPSVRPKGKSGYSDENLKGYVAGLADKAKAHKEKMGYGDTYNPKYTVEHGQRYAKVVTNDGSSRSVHSFIDKQTGNILKANSWKAPHPTPRGNIGDDNFGLKNVDHFGARYLTKADGASTLDTAVEQLEQVMKFNENHDEQGRFSSGDGAGGKTDDEKPIAHPNLTKQLTNAGYKRAPEDLLDIGPDDRLELWTHPNRDPLLLKVHGQLQTMISTRTLLTDQKIARSPEGRLFLQQVMKAA